jgi:histidine triad (HIT) family protein
VLAFRDIHPVAPTHVLVIPKKPISMLSEATEDDAALLGQVLLGCKAVANALGLMPGGFRVVMNNGEGAGQTVFHMHAHVIAGRSLTWPPG